MDDLLGVGSLTSRFSTKNRRMEALLLRMERLFNDIIDHTISHRYTDHFRSISASTRLRYRPVAGHGGQSWGGMGKAAYGLRQLALVTT